MTTGEGTVLHMSDGSLWSPSKSVELLHCANCGNVVDTPEEQASYPDGQCPECNQVWTGSEGRGVRITVTAPAPIAGRA